MWSDTESDRDYLNFGEVSQLAVDILNSPDMLPVSIGIFGNWGAGKSSLLKLIENELAEQQTDENQKWIVIKFDAWLYQGYDDAKAALLEVIATELTQVAQSDKTLSQKAHKLLSRVNPLRMLGLTAESIAILSGMPTGGLLARTASALGGLSDGVQDEEEYKELAKVGGEAQKQAANILKPKDKQSPPQQIDDFRREYSEILAELGKPLVVIIDNLDRCLPANAIHTLEAIRLFLFLNNTAFIIAADEEMIRFSVAEYFKGGSERHQIDYVDKLIQVPVRVPKAGVREIRAYLFMLYAIDFGLPEDNLETLRTGLESSLQHAWKDDPITRQEALRLAGEPENSKLDGAYERAERIAPMLANSSIIHGNPRTVKRLLNVVKMRSRIAKRRNIPLDEGIITKLVIFERCAGTYATADLYRLIDAEQGTPVILKHLENEEYTAENLPEGAPDSWSRNPATKAFILDWGRLEPKLGDIDLRAAIYLSRETMPVGAYAVGLSPIGREILDVLINVQNLTSPIATKRLPTLPLEEQVPVMEGILNHLRQISDWSRRPKGFAGGCLLAEHSSDAAKVFVHFLSGLGLEKTPPWMNALLKDKQWYGDA